MEIKPLREDYLLEDLTVELKTLFEENGFKVWFYEVLNSYAVTISGEDYDRVIKMYKIVNILRG